MYASGEVDEILITDKEFPISDGWTKKQIYRDEEVEKFKIWANGSTLTAHNHWQNEHVKVLEGCFIIKLFESTNPKDITTHKNVRIVELCDGDDLDIPPFLFHEITGEGELISVMRPPLSVRPVE